MSSISIFLAWSRPKSKSVAELLRVFLVDVVQGVEPFVSFLGIEAGSNWQNKLHDSLSTSRLGLLFITSENIGNPWMHFEAGVLSGKGRRVIPYLVDLEVKDAPRGPLERLQTRRLDKETVWELTAIVADIAAHPDRNATDDFRAIEDQEHLRTDQRVRQKFERHWPELERNLTAHTAIAAAPSIATIHRLKNRNAMYLAAKDLVESSKEYVFDTTWGRPTDGSTGHASTKRAQPQTSRPNPAREAYLAAREKGIHSATDGSYHELILNCDRYRDRIEAGTQMANASASYQMTVVDGGLAAFPLPDFMVVDGTKTLLVGYHRAGNHQNDQFLMIESEELAGFMMSWFDECVRQPNEASQGRKSQPRRRAPSSARRPRKPKR